MSSGIAERLEADGLAGAAARWRASDYVGTVQALLEEVRRQTDCPHARLGEGDLYCRDCGAPTGAALARANRAREGAEWEAGQLRAQVDVLKASACRLEALYSDAYGEVHQPRPAGGVESWPPLANLVRGLVAARKSDAAQISGLCAELDSQRSLHAGVRNDYAALAGELDAVQGDSAAMRDALEQVNDYLSERIRECGGGDRPQAPGARLERLSDQVLAALARKAGPAGETITQLRLELKNARADADRLRRQCEDELRQIRAAAEQVPDGTSLASYVRSLARDSGRLDDVKRAIGYEIAKGGLADQVGRVVYDAHQLEVVRRELDYHGGDLPGQVRHLRTRNADLERDREALLARVKKAEALQREANEGEVSAGLERDRYRGLYDAAHAEVCQLTAKLREGAVSGAAEAALERAQATVATREDAIRGRDTQIAKLRQEADAQRAELAMATRNLSDALDREGALRGQLKALSDQGERQDRELRHLREVLPRKDKQIADLTISAAQARGPVPLLLRCPLCHIRHVDRGENAVKHHKVHACQNPACGHLWQPALVPTVGVEVLPGCLDPLPAGACLPEVAEARPDAGEDDRAQLARALAEAKRDARERIAQSVEGAIVTGVSTAGVAQVAKRIRDLPESSL